MKISLLTAALAVAALYLLLPSCAHLAGTTIEFDENGAATILPPQRPIIIEPSK